VKTQCAYSKWTHAEIEKQMRHGKYTETQNTAQYKLGYSN